MTKQSMTPLVILLLLVLTAVSLVAQGENKQFLPVVIFPKGETATPLPPTATPAPTLVPTATPNLRREDAGDQWNECSLFGCTLVLFEGINTENCIAPFILDEDKSTFTVGGVSTTWANFELDYGYPIYDRERGTRLELFSLKVPITSLAAEMQPPFANPDIYYVVGYCSLTQ